jgi:hypothetical protein
MAWVLSADVASGPNDAALTLSGYQPQIPGGSATIDGVAWSTLALSPGTRVLLLNQGGSPGVPAASNGVWVIPNSGSSLNRPTATNDYVHLQPLDNETVVRRRHHPERQRLEPVAEPPEADVYPVDVAG